MLPPSYEEVKVSQLDEGCLLAEIDGPSKVNKLTDTLWDELGQLLTRCEADSSITSLVIASAKPGVFLAGADLQGFVGVSDEKLQTMLSRAHRVFNQLENSRIPIVAAVAGAAMGGGFELLLAAHGVVAVDDDRIKLGLPETSLGLIPGAGGTQRLPSIVGIDMAVDIICSGQTLAPRAAERLNLVDKLCEPANVLAEAIALARELARTGFRPRRLRIPIEYEAGVTEAELLKLAYAREAARKGSPACLAACEAIVQGAYVPLSEGLLLEAKAFRTLMHSDATQTAIRRYLTARTAV